MRRVLAIAILIAGLVAGASVAEAAVKKGAFTGRSSAQDPMGLKVSRGGKVYAIYFEGVRLQCSDGDAFDMPSGANRVQTPNGTLIRVGTKRRFSIHARNASSGFGWDAAGRFDARGSRVAGTLEVHASFDEQDRQDANGSVRCTSGTLSFSLKRTAPRRRG